MSADDTTLRIHVDYNSREFWIAPDGREVQGIIIRESDAILASQRVSLTPGMPVVLQDDDGEESDAVLRFDGEKWLGDLTDSVGNYLDWRIK